MKKSSSPTLAKGLKKLNKKFEEGSSYEVKCNRRRNKIASKSIENVVTELQEGTNSGVQTGSARGIVISLDLHLNTVHKILRNTQGYYPYKITYVQKLLPADLPVKYTFVLEILARMEMNSEWPRNILWTDKGYFYLKSFIKT